MQADVTTLDAKKAGTVELPDDVFGLEPRPDILHRMVRYQLAKRRGGTRSVQDRSEVNYTDGQALQAEGHRPRASRQPQGAPVPWRRQGVRPEAAEPRHRAAEEGQGAGAEARAVGQGQIRHARGDRQMRAERGQDQGAEVRFSKLGLGSVLIIDGAAVQEAFAKAARNLPGVDVLPVAGINVYDILNHDKLVLTKAAVEALEARFK